FCMTEMARFEGVPPNMSVRMITPLPWLARSTASRMSLRRCSTLSSGPMAMVSTSSCGPTTCSMADLNSLASAPCVTSTRPIMRRPHAVSRWRSATHDIPIPAPCRPLVRTGANPAYPDEQPPVSARPLRYSSKLLSLLALSTAKRANRLCHQQHLMAEGYDVGPGHRCPRQGVAHQFGGQLIFLDQPHEIRHQIDDQMEGNEIAVGPTDDAAPPQFDEAGELRRGLHGQFPAGLDQIDPVISNKESGLAAHLPAVQQGQRQYGFAGSRRTTQQHAGFAQHETRAVHIMRFRHDPELTCGRAAGQP